MPSPIDRFQGHILQTNGVRIAYAVILVPDPRDTRLTLGVIDIPSQALTGASLSAISFVRGERVEFELDASGRPHWLGVFAPSGSIRCTYSQSAIELPCTMEALPVHGPSRAGP